MRTIVLVSVLAWLIGGCAIGNQHQYALNDLKFNAKSEKQVVIGVQDRRSYVVDGNKAPNFVGIQRGGFGNPFDVTTTSGRGLADDMASSIATALSSRQIAVRTVSVSEKDDTDDALKKLLAEKAERSILLVVSEWKADTYASTGLTYDLRIRIFSGDGTRMIQKAISGKDSLGASFVPADARVNVENAYRNKLEGLFNDPDVLAALQ